MKGGRPTTGLRPAWKGSLKLSLVSVPVRAYAATTTAPDVAFRQLHRRCHTPIQLKKWCPHCREEVKGSQIVRGYETSKHHYVLVEDEEIDALRPDATHVIELSHVIGASRIGPIHVERTYFLTPDSKTAGAGLAVLRDALDDQAAIGRVALHGRDYLVAVEAFEAALIMYTLRTAGEVRDLSAAAGVEFARGAKVTAAEVGLARQILGGLTTPRDLTAFTDPYEASLRAMLAKKGGRSVAAPEAPGSGKVVDLMQALRASMAAVGTRPPTRARAAGRLGQVVGHPPSQRRAARRAG